MSSSVPSSSHCQRLALRHHEHVYLPLKSFQFSFEAVVGVLGGFAYPVNCPGCSPRPIRLGGRMLLASRQGCSLLRGSARRPALRHLTEPEPPAGAANFRPLRLLPAGALRLAATLRMGRMRPLASWAPRWTPSDPGPATSSVSFLESWAFLGRRNHDDLN